MIPVPVRSEFSIRSHTALHNGKHVRRAMVKRYNFEHLFTQLQGKIVKPGSARKKMVKKLVKSNTWFGIWILVYIIFYISRMCINLSLLYLLWNSCHICYMCIVLVCSSKIKQHNLHKPNNPNFSDQWSRKRGSSHVIVWCHQDEQDTIIRHSWQMIQSCRQSKCFYLNYY